MKVFLDTNSLWGQALLGGEVEKSPKRAWPQRGIFGVKSGQKGWKRNFFSCFSKIVPFLFGGTKNTCYLCLQLTEKLTLGKAHPIKMMIQ